MNYFYHSLLLLTCVCLNTSLCLGQGSETKTSPATSVNSTSKEVAVDKEPKSIVTAPSQISSVRNLGSPAIERQLAAINDSNQELNGGISRIFFITVLISLLFALYAYALVRPLFSIHPGILHISEELRSIKNGISNQSASKKISNGFHQNDLQANVNAKGVEIREMVKSLGDRDRELAQTKESLRNKTHELNNLQIEKGHIDELYNRLKLESEGYLNKYASKVRDLDELRTEHSSLKSAHTNLESAHKNLKLALIPSSTVNLPSSLSDDLISSLSEDSTHAISLLGCLGMVKVASKIDISEEVLLTTVRQFSESLTAFRMQQERPVELVQQELVEWANIFNKQFDGKLEIRVPTPGFSIDSKTMISSSGALKVSVVYSWSVYNSKGSVFSPAKVA